MNFPRIGIVGAGYVASAQIYPNLAAAGLKLAAVCDRERDKAVAKSAQYGGAIYDDLEQMLAEAELDGVILCVGPEFHCAGAKRVLEAGLPVYTEKPPALCADDLWPVVELARERELLAMTAMKKRYADVYRRGKAFIDSAECGRPQHLQMLRVTSIRWKNQTSRSDFLLDYGVHNIDLACWLFGAVDAVQAWSIGKQVYQATLHFGNGALGSISFVERPGSPPSEELQITGSDGWMAIADQSHYRLATGGTITELCDPNFTTAAGDGGAVTGHRSELEAFAQALRDGTRPPSAIEESYRSMCVYDATIRAVASGEREVVRDRSREPAPA